MSKGVAIIKTGISRHVMLEKILASKSAVIPDTVGFIGNFDHYPNIEGIVWYLDHCHAQILKAIPRYRFVIMGKGPLDRVRPNYAHFESSVSWQGPIEDVVSELQKMEVCAAPLINGAGLRGKVNQYAILAKPIASTSIGCCGTPYQNEVSVFISDDPTEYSNYIIKLLKDKEFAKKMGERAYRVVKDEFLWEKPINSLISLFNQ
ncbi:MAG: glycosyltransferase [Bdellovibrionales bacterium]|nr:glycosyltransferase [Bdellovibrionales bacterium]